jgi:Na+/H+ antiporter NhaD/arsenite permease-like protein
MDVSLQEVALPQPIASPPDTADTVMLSGMAFVAVCASAAAAIAFAGRSAPMPVWLLGAEVMATILGLFVFGSFRYQIHKNALTYGMLLVIVATFWALPTSEWHVAIARAGVWPWVRNDLLTFHGLDELVHADTMLFILGLTCFVAVIAQTRLLEGFTFRLLRVTGGAVAPTVIAVTAFVSVVSGVLGGVSMIGLMIRTLVILLMLAAAPTAAIRPAVMVCTMVTTICGIWSAYGEPPNLIMKANLSPVLDNAFFLRYCLPSAIASYLVVVWNLRNWLGGERIDVARLDVIDARAEDVRFLQARRHGEVLTPVELVENHGADLGHRFEAVLNRLRHGESLGTALVGAGVPPDLRQRLLGHFVSEELAESLDRHYVLDAAGDHLGARAAQRDIDVVLADMAHRRRRAQLIGATALLPFIALVIAHSLNPAVPLFLSAFAAFCISLLGIVTIPRMRALAFREARHEYAEYYFLFPLFISITLLTKAGFFDSIQQLIAGGVSMLGHGHMAFAQFLSSTLLSAILDNNIVADFASRGLHHLDASLVHLFALAQIAGYALGGCWTHIGSAQSVVAFAFIRRNVDDAFTPVQWIREMTPVILQMLVVITVLIYLESALLSWFR